MHLPSPHPCYVPLTSKYHCPAPPAAPPILNSSSHTGFWEAINVISDNTGVGVMYFIGAALWAVEFLWSFWVLKLVYSCFRGQGHTVRSVKNDAAATGVRSQV